jgi:hypothetical protein
MLAASRPPELAPPPLLESLAAWAWARHHNVLSWYIRPMLLAPYCLAAHQHSPLGMGLSVLAMATSMAWFPAPAPGTTAPAVVAALEAEKEYLLGPWDLRKWVMAGLVPLGFGCLGVACWRRSWKWGLGVLHVMGAIKVAWTYVFFPSDAAAAHLLAALLGFAICDAAIFLLIVVMGARKRRAAPGHSGKDVKMD